MVIFIMKTKKLKTLFIRCASVAFAVMLCIQSLGTFANAAGANAFSEEELSFINAIENSASAGKINHW